MSDEMMVSCIILRVRRPVLCVIQMSREGRGGETCLMFPSGCQSRATSALLTFSVFPWSESLSSLSTQEPRPVQSVTVSVDVIVVILGVALSLSLLCPAPPTLL